MSDAAVGGREIGSQVERLAGWVSGLRLEALPPAVVEKARVILLHNLAVALAGAEAGGDAGAAYLVTTKQADPHGATAFLLGARVPLEAAVLANGILFHARAQDDVQHGAGSHLGAVVLPAALAVAEWAHASGRDLLTAIVAGYEAASAIGLEFSTISTPRGFRSSGVYGPFGSAAAASVLLGLDRARTAHALSLAANFAAGLNQTWLAGTGEFRVQTALAARNGVLAALLARAGAESAPDVLEGAAGFYAAYTGVPRDIGERLDRLGTDWRIFDVNFKPYPVCGINQVPVHLMLDTITRWPFEADAVASITVGLTPYEARYPGIDAHGPFRDTGATLMSTQFSLATAIRGRGVRYADLRRFEDRELMALVRKIDVTGQPDLPPYGCSLAIRLLSGRLINAENRRGADNFKFTWEEAVAVACRLRAEMYVTDAQFAQLLEVLTSIEKVEDMRLLVEPCVDLGAKPRASRRTENVEPGG